MSRQHCVSCGSSAVYDGLTIITMHRQGKPVRIINVPVYWCSSCGEQWMHAKVVLRVERLADDATKAIVDYETGLQYDKTEERGQDIR